MASAPLTIGFIGGGLTSAIGQTHKIAAMMDGRWRLSAGCFSLDSAENVQTARAWGVPRERTYASWKELLALEKGRLDAVAILTPTPSHTDIVIGALEQQYPVICEKALTTSSAQALRIRDALGRHRGFLAVTYNYTGYPMLRALKRRIDRGALGRLHQIHVEMPQEGFAKRGKDNRKIVPQAWRLKDYEIPTLSLDLGVHIHQLIGFLSGERPTDVVCLNNTFGHFPGIVDNSVALARYTGSLRSQIWFSKSALGHRNGLRVRVYGTKGSAEWFQMQPETIAVSDNRGGMATLDRASAEIEIADEPRYNRFKAGHPAGFMEAFANHYADLADAVHAFQKKGRFSSPWVFGVETAGEGLVMLEAMARSARLNAWQPVKSRTF